MGLIQVLRLNNRPYSWNSSETRFDGQLWPGCVEIVHGDELEVETVYSQTGDGAPIGGTGGQYSAELSVKMLAADADALTTMLTLSHPEYLGSYGQIEFPFSTSVSEPLLPGDIPITLVAPVCRIIGDKQTYAKGIEALVTEFKLWTKGFTRNGKSLYTRPLPNF